MTDKELRKLSRLELLELLLEVSKENEKLNEKIKKLTEENENAKRIDNLAEATRQINTSLQYVNNLCLTLNVTPEADNANDLITEELKSPEENIPEEKNEASENEEATEDTSPESKKENEPEATADCVSDKDLYCRIMNFYAKNNNVLNTLPNDIKNDIVKRIGEILKKRMNSMETKDKK